MIEEEDDRSWESAFQDRFKGRAGLEQRLKDERKASRTPKQRAAKKPPKKQTNFRASVETRAQIDALKKHLSKDQTAIIAMAIDMLAKAELAGGKK